MWHTHAHVHSFHIPQVVQGGGAQRNVAAMESDFALLHKTISTTATTTPAADAKRKRKKALYALGSQVKYLIVERSRECLHDASCIPVVGEEEYAAALATVAVIEELSSSHDLLTLFLDARRACLRSQVCACLLFVCRAMKEGARGGEGRVGKYATVLAAVAVMEELLSHDLLALFRDAREACLRSHGEYAAALAAVVVMEELSLRSLLALFLDARGACMRSQVCACLLFVRAAMKEGARGGEGRVGECAAAMAAMAVMEELSSHEHCWRSCRRSWSLLTEPRESHSFPPISHTA
ncbi:unnamed protein product [Closterium sp. Naga37s-1]|nr:unnamed protein product [Closterium sp. Naga37s-1]